MGISNFLLCTSITLYWADRPYTAMIAPKGNCQQCCPVNEKSDISFLLYTTLNSKTPQRLYLNDKNLLYHSNFDRRAPTVIYVHGFTEQANGKASTTIKNAYLKRGNYNIILVDWSSLSAVPWYAHAVANTPIVGKYLSDFIKFLITNGVPIKSIHLIGFSLGAEIVGFTGKNTTFGRLPRITGLDPAFPLYMFAGQEGHLASTDAEFVDVIHTDGGVFGFPTPLGHVDFFPNGGFPTQPGCEISLMINDQFQNLVSCSHDRAWQYYAESVLNEEGFPATKCSSYETFVSGQCKFLGNNTDELQFMGFAANPNLKGNFYLITNNRAPYARKYSCL